MSFEVQNLVKKQEDSLIQQATEARVSTPILLLPSTTTVIKAHSEEAVAKKRKNIEESFFHTKTGKMFRLLGIGVTRVGSIATFAVGGVVFAIRWPILLCVGIIGWVVPFFASWSYPQESFIVRADACFNDFLDNYFHPLHRLSKRINSYIFSAGCKLFTWGSLNTFENTLNFSIKNVPPFLKKLAKRLDPHGSQKKIEGVELLNVSQISTVSKCIFDARTSYQIHEDFFKSVTSEFVKNPATTTERVYYAQMKKHFNAISINAINQNKATLKSLLSANSSPIVQ